jgi:hypothetical protein
MIQLSFVPAYREPRRLIAARHKRASVSVSTDRRIVALSLLPSCVKYVR